MSVISLSFFFRYPLFRNFVIFFLRLVPYVVPPGADTGNGGTAAAHTVIQYGFPRICISLYQVFEQCNRLFRRVHRFARMRLCIPQYTCRVFLPAPHPRIFRLSEFPIVSVLSLLCSIRRSLPVQRFSLRKLRIECRLPLIEHRYLLVPTQRHPVRVQKARRQYLIPDQVVPIPRPVALHEVDKKLPLSEQQNRAVFLDYPRILFPQRRERNRLVPRIVRFAVRKIA